MMILNQVLADFFDIADIFNPQYMMSPLEANQKVYAQYDYNYTNLHHMERKYFIPGYLNLRSSWMAENWYMSIVFSAIYIVIMFAGQRLMRDRPRFTLQGPLIVWNLLLAVFSLCGSYRFLQHLVFVVNKHGLEHSICVNDFIYGVTACWGWQFALSKVAELVDTVFIVLRKQPLIFLHWYHHSTVLIYTWYSISDFTSTARWFCGINFTVHTLMYGYYAFRAMKFKIPKWVNVVITTLQLSQMVWGVYLNVFVFMAKNAGKSCAVSYNNVYWSFFMYFTYFLLFFNYFYHAYLKKSPTKTTNGQVKKAQ